PEYHFDLCRPGIGLYGGLPYDTALPVIKLSIPVIQSRTVFAGETVGYGGQWRAKTDTRVATISAGYADGLIRAIGNGQLLLYHGDVGCPLIGRVSMDLITVDITQLEDTPRSLDLINKIQTVDIIANAANTIGYEILTSLGARYAREYIKG
ncbi:alanine racemase, partial [Amylibacter sp.]|nr:alanine racemase [Amylibacter sp.]